MNIAPNLDYALTRTIIRLVVPAFLIAIVGLLVIVPLLMIVFSSLTTELPFSGNKQIVWTLANYAALWRPEIAEALGNTLVVSIGGTMMSMAVGCTIAWLAARTDIPCKPLVYLVGVMPLFVSLVVASITWSFLASGRSGYLNIIFNSLGLPLHVEVQSLAGITFVHGLYYVPYPFIFLYSALSLVHPDLEEAAAVHGASLRRTLKRVTFPLVKPALIGAMLLTFVAAIEEFPVPSILGGPVGIDTLSVSIYKLVTRIPGDPNQAGAVSILLTAIVCVLVYTQRRILHGKDFRTVTGKGMQRRLVPLGRMKGVALGFVGFYALVALGLPIMALLIGATRVNLYVPNAASLFDPSTLSPRFIVAAINDPTVQQGLMNSLIAGFSAALFGGTLFFLVSYVVNRTKLPGRQLLEYMSMLPLALPALVMGLGILWTWVALPVPIYGTLIILIVAFITRFMPQGFRAISSSISQIHDELEEAAMVAGASRPLAVYRITLPLLRGAILSSGFLMIVLGMRELTASLFLYTTKTRVLSIVIFEAYDNGDWTAVASISLVYTAVLAILTLIARRWMRSEI